MLMWLRWLGQGRLAALYRVSATPGGGGRDLTGRALPAPWTPSEARPNSPVCGGLQPRILALSAAECQENLESPPEEAIFALGTLVGGVPTAQHRLIPLPTGGCIT